MAAVHTLKKTKREAVLKIYKTDSNGGTVQVEANSSYIMVDGETYVQSTSTVEGSRFTIKEIFWGAKKDKQIDISRVNNAVANTIHGHYYLLNSGHYDFNGFVDDTYSNGAIRVVGDGPFHVILKLHKNGYEY